MRVENNNVSGQNHDPEQIDLIDLLVQLWRGKMTIIISVIVAIALAIGCSCPLISRQGLYLKLTLPADVDILAESDNPTHYADGFHCNARSPLQGYAMPFLHSVSA